MKSIRRLVIVTQHFYSSKRKANFHFLADAFANLGIEVTFVTTQISPISWLKKGDTRLCPELWQESGRIIEKRPNLRSFVWLTPFHTFTLKSKLADQLSGPFFNLYERLPLGKLAPVLKNADAVLFESGGAILLTDRIRKINGTAKLIYRPSDDLTHLGSHRNIVNAERKHRDKFSLISVPSRRAAQHFDGHRNVRYQPHGIDKLVFETSAPSPYPGSKRVNAVSVGSSFFDYKFIELAAQSFPDWQFHVIGTMASKSPLNNITYYDEMPFHQTIPHLRHADIGLAPYVDHASASGLADSSLKIVQYTWNRLPVVAPVFCMRTDRPHIFGYEHSQPVSIVSALQSASTFDRSTIDRSPIKSWSELAVDILESAT
ncbi:GumK N-terminal domain-containing glycosyltransferase [Planctomicrobium sp. SH527]|uniref:GumK N-terminal domain-containing glycosyltransferase n=1 Tax=Planctomicrobium sp. SH527 TaxID=3448123 RepID=UPI003F5B52A7